MDLGRSARIVHVVVAVVVVVTILTSSVGRCFAASPQEIDRAIARGVEWLYAQQKDGHWERSPAPDGQSRPWQPQGGQWGGVTALATAALLAAGERPQDPRLAPAIEFLKSADVKGVYAIALRAQVWQHLSQSPQIKQLILKDASMLRAMLIQRGPGRGFFDYLGVESSNYSHSRGNYGVLGMWALEQSGVVVAPEFWQTVEEGWVGHQHPSGGWTYKAPSETDHPVTPGMTAAGVATLFITQDYLAANRGIDCRPVEPFEPLERGLQWLIDNFDKVGVDDPTHRREFHYPTWYAIERVAVASGLRTFGEIDWYQRGADWFIERQRSSGAWDDGRGGGDVIDTSFALLFLARGRAPLVFNKLDYSESDDTPARWNNRPRDAANLSRFIGRSMERDLNWQIVSASAPLEVLHEAPILYVAGRDEWKPSDELKAKLKSYIETGGLVLAVADCQGRPFANSVQKLGQELFPQYTFRPLPNDHAIYARQQFPRSAWRTKPEVLGLSNGVRELIVLIPQGDPGRVWQLNNDRQRPETWQLAADVVQYAVDHQNLRTRGTSHYIATTPAKPEERSIRVARLQYEGNWDPEPAGWSRLSQLMTTGSKVALETIPTTISDLEKSDVRIAHLTGTDAIALSTDQKAQLKVFTENGGTLVIDAAGGSPAFADSVEAVLKDLFGDTSLAPLEPSHALYTSGDSVLGEVTFRRFAQEQLGRSGGSPRVQAVTDNGRIVAFYSREDLSAGLVGQPIDGIYGYDPADASRLMSRILLHVSK